MIAPLRGRAPVVPASAFIAPTAVVVGDVILGEESLVAAGCVVLEGTIVPPRSFVAGVPGVIRGAIPPAIHARLRESARHYVELAREHAALHAAR